jgi:hypothetical protein
MKLLIRQFSPVSCHFIPLRPPLITQSWNDWRNTFWDKTLRTFRNLIRHRIWRVTYYHGNTIYIRFHFEHVEQQTARPIAMYLQRRLPPRNYWEIHRIILDMTQNFLYCFSHLRSLWRVCTWVSFNLSFETVKNLVNVMCAINYTETLCRQFLNSWDSAYKMFWNSNNITST